MEEAFLPEVLVRVHFVEARSSIILELSTGARDTRTGEVDKRVIYETPQPVVGFSRQSQSLMKRTRRIWSVVCLGSGSAVSCSRVIYG